MVCHSKNQSKPRRGLAHRTSQSNSPRAVLIHKPIDNLDPREEIKHFVVLARVTGGCRSLLKIPRCLLHLWGGARAAGPSLGRTWVSMSTGDPTCQGSASSQARTPSHGSPKGRRSSRTRREGWGSVVNLGVFGLPSRAQSKAWPPTGEAQSCLIHLAFKAQFVEALQGVTSTCLPAAPLLYPIG
jgi:hypothetical protein